MSHRALGHRFRVEADPPLRDVLAEALAPLVDLDGARDVVVIKVTSDGERWSISEGNDNLIARTAGHALARTLEHINQRAAASVMTGAPLHAAAVRHPSGRLVALAGLSGSGKSTLCAAAVQAGWGFVAEEVTAVQANTFVVLPYRRPIGLRSGGAAAIGVTCPVRIDGVFDEVYPWPIPSAQWADGGPLDAVALITRRPGAPTSDIVAPPQALAELIEHVVVPRDDAVVAVFRSVESLVRTVPVARLGFATPGEGLRLLNDLLDDLQVDPTDGPMEPAPQQP